MSESTIHKKLHEIDRLTKRMPQSYDSDPEHLQILKAEFHDIVVEGLDEGITNNIIHSLCEIEMEFYENRKKLIEFEELNKIGKNKFVTGKHIGKTFEFIRKTNPYYFGWLMNQPVGTVLEFHDFITYCCDYLKT
uniref:Uncharacterized protein n=1 Tax=viral metagenome TaxID=1070528 RepID=A0A6C0J6H1_9ZZZZ